MSQKQNKIHSKKISYWQPIQENSTNFFNIFSLFLFSLILLESMTGFCILIKKLRKCDFVSAQD